MAICVIPAGGLRDLLGIAAKIQVGIIVRGELLFLYELEYKIRRLDSVHYDNFVLGRNIP